MDQNSFRQLLQPSSSSKPAAASKSRGSLLKTATKKAAPTTKAANEPAFQPRKVKKKAGGDYRDRAAERREGKESDYAQVEAVLEDFEKRNADHEDLEEKRKYLGGDSEHTVLVKGLDLALLEQNKARLSSVTSKQDDEDLEAAFAGSPTSASTSTIPAKRSRADVLRELKEKRAASGASGAASAPAIPPPGPTLEDKQLAAGKFKPIGFKPVGEKAKKKKKKEEGGREKKKRKVAEDVVEAEPALPPPTATAETSTTTSTVPRDVAAATSMPAVQEEPGPLDDDVDIFADAGDYEGPTFDSDDDEDGAEDRPRHRDSSPPVGAPRRGWFDDPREPIPPPESEPGPSTAKHRSTSASAPGPSNVRSASPPDEDADMEEERAVRLQPLASSTVPSIKDLLALDDAVEKEEKRRARKEKKKGKGGGGGGGGEADKANRDYQRLQAFEAKKGK